MGFAVGELSCVEVFDGEVGWYCLVGLVDFVLDGDVGFEVERCGCWYEEKSDEGE